MLASSVCNSDQSKVISVSWFELVGIIDEMKRSIYIIDNEERKVFVFEINLTMKIDVESIQRYCYLIIILYFNLTLFCSEQLLRSKSCFV